MSLPDPLSIRPFNRPARGEILLPGSKSITNRALLLAALGGTTVTLHGALFSRDTRIMTTALQVLGFGVQTDETALTITITGRGGEIPVREAEINVGNAGTAARFLTAFVCLQPDGIYHFVADEAMRRRPIGALLGALASQGAQASATAFPFTLRTAGLPGGNRRTRCLGKQPAPVGTALGRTALPRTAQRAAQGRNRLPALRSDDGAHGPAVCRPASHLHHRGGCHRRQLLRRAPPCHWRHAHVDQSSSWVAG